MPLYAGNTNISGELILNADIGASAPTENAGIEINRGSSANVSLRWNESLDVWQTTVDGTNYNTIATNNDVSTAYSNATSYADTIAATAYSNATSTAATDASTKAATAYSNAVSTAATDASSKAATAYSNAVAYAASNTYVNSTFAPKADPTFTGTVTLSAISANGSTGTSGQVLTSNGTSTYWAAAAGGGGATINVLSITSSSTINVNCSSYDIVSVTALSESTTIAAPTGTPVDGQRLTYRIKDNGTARSVSWTTSAGGFRSIGVTLPTVSVISQLMFVGCMWNDVDGYWDVIAYSQQ